MLVALHGFTETDLGWQEALAPTGLALTTPLMPGHGWRPCPSGTTLPSCAADIVVGLPQRPVDLLGYSMGGRIALSLALQHPGRVRRLILVSSRPGIQQTEWREARCAHDEALAEILEEDGIGAFVAWWENQRILKAHRPLSTDQIHDLRSVRLNQDPLGLAAALRCLGQGVMTPLWSRLTELTMPTLLIAGAADAEFLTDMRRMAETMPAARLAVVPDCGHAIHREAPAELRSIISNFLADCPVPA